MRAIFAYVTLAAVALALAPASAAGQPIPMPDHVVIAILENHGFGQIIGSPSAPYINGLVPQGALLTNSFGITHPSQPNYIALFSGSQQGVANNNTPTGVPFTTPNLGAQMIASGRTFTGYSELLPSFGSTDESAGGVNGYVRRHNPWVNWQQAVGGPPPPMNQLAATTNQPFTAFPADYATLPTLSFVVPSLMNDMHVPNGTIEQGDAWVSANLDGYVQWAKTHNSLFVLTFDEDDITPVNQVATILVGQPVQPGVTSNQMLDHYGLLATVEDMYGLPRIGNAVGVSSLTGVFTPVPEPGSLALVAGAGLAGLMRWLRNRPRSVLPLSTDA
jgi:hypothetical protein